MPDLMLDIEIQAVLEHGEKSTYTNILYTFYIGLSINLDITHCGVQFVVCGGGWWAVIGNSIILYCLSFVGKIRLPESH